MFNYFNLLLQWRSNLKCVNNGKKLKVIHDESKVRIKEQCFEMSYKPVVFTG